MILRRFGAILLTSIGLLFAPTSAWAQAVRVVESAPRASAVIEGRSSEFFVRFDRPIDHIHSTLAIARNGQVIEKLHPSLDSAAQVLFARAPTLAPGDYELQWVVRSVTGTDVIHGAIPFTVKQ